MLRRGWAAVRARGLLWAVMAPAYLVCYLAVVNNRPLFAPDTRYYAGMALWFSGTDQDSAARLVAQRSALSGWESPGADVLFGWGLVQPRVVYPALSAPFVKLFGIDGMVVVPGVAMALLVLALMLFLGKQYGSLAALGTMLIVCVSPRLMFYGSAMLTESLSALWCALMLAVAWRYARTPSRRGLALLVVLTVVSGFTRQATLIPAGAFVVAWVAALAAGRRPNPWTAPAAAVAVTSVAVQLVQLWLFPGFSQVNQFKAQTGADSLGGAILAAPALAWRILEVDVSRLAVADQPLLVFLALSLVSLVVFWRRPESHMLVGALLAYELYNVTNGVPTGFRYGMPGLPFFAASVALLLSEAAWTARRRTASAQASTYDAEAGRLNPAGRAVEPCRTGGSTVWRR